MVNGTDAVAGPKASSYYNDNAVSSLTSESRWRSSLLFAIWQSDHDSMMVLLFFLRSTNLRRLKIRKVLTVHASRLSH